MNGGQCHLVFLFWQTYSLSAQYEQRTGGIFFYYNYKEVNYHTTMMKKKKGWKKKKKKKKRIEEGVTVGLRFTREV